MSRGTRFITLAIPLTFIYLLALLGFVPVPLVSQQLADQILPVVSDPLNIARLGCAGNLAD